VRDRGIRLLVHCALPRPSRKCPSPRWAAVFGRWFPTPRRTSAFCWCIQRARGHWRLPIGQARRLHAKHFPTPWEFALRLSDRLPPGGIQCVRDAWSMRYRTQDLDSSDGLSAFRVTRTFFRHQGSRAGSLHAGPHRSTRILSLRDPRGRG